MTYAVKHRKFVTKMGRQIHIAQKVDSVFYRLWDGKKADTQFLLRTVFMPQCSAVDLAYHLCHVYVG